MVLKAMCCAATLAVSVVALQPRGEDALSFIQTQIDGVAGQRARLATACECKFLDRHPGACATAAGYCHQACCKEIVQAAKSAQRHQAPAANGTSQHSEACGCDWASSKEACAGAGDVSSHCRNFCCSALEGDDATASASALTRASTNRATHRLTHRSANSSRKNLTNSSRHTLTSGSGQYFADTSGHRLNMTNGSRSNSTTSSGTKSSQASTDVWCFDLLNGRPCSDPHDHEHRMDLAYTGERRTGKAEEKDGAGKLYK
mmetsp:Transcript_76128/g.215292  ORF Transcript_76128/g.215292 Transcript_76128/m.215292 type:complete len:260 (-) Transcript_76128:197-976(-)